MMSTRLLCVAAAVTSASLLPCASTSARRATLPRMQQPKGRDKRQGGYYKRPSAALEQGGSFYVPGLEGPRLRVAGAAVLSVGLVLNRLLSQSGLWGGQAAAAPQGSQVVSECLGALGCALIFIQVALQQKIEAEVERDELRAALASRLSERQELSPALDATCASRTRWAAAALLRITPARAVVWVSDASDEAEAEMLLRFGRFPDATGELLPSSSQPLRALLPEGATSALVDFSDKRPPPPLPSNAESAALCVCGPGILAMASERAAAFTPKEQRYLELCCALIEGPSGG